MEENKKEYEAIIDPLEYPETLETEILKGGTNAYYRLPKDRARVVKGKCLHTIDIFKVGSAIGSIWT